MPRRREQSGEEPKPGTFAYEVKTARPRLPRNLVNALMGLKIGFDGMEDNKTHDPVDASRMILFDNYKLRVEDGIPAKIALEQIRDIVNRINSRIVRAEGGEISN